MMLTDDINLSMTEAVVLGGAVLGSGGGGQLEMGLRLGQLTVERGIPAVGELTKLPDQAQFAIVTTLHSSSSDINKLSPGDCHQTMALLQNKCHENFAGVVNAGSGAVDSLIGWELASLLNLPLVDMVINPGFHPIPAFNLLEGLTTQTGTFSLAVVGASSLENGHVELFCQGAPHKLYQVLEQIAYLFNGTFAVAVGPVSKTWLKTHGNPQLISRTLAVGNRMQCDDGAGEATAIAISQMLGGQVVTFGTITDIKWCAFAP